MHECAQPYTFEESLLEGSKSFSQERHSSRTPLVIPKLPIGRLGQDRFRQLPQTKSHRLHLRQEEDVRQQARSLLMQGRLESIRFLSPKHLDQACGMKLHSEPAEPLLEINTSRSRFAGEANQNLEQQLKIRTVECEGLRAQILLEEAKHQTELLLRDRKIKRLQQQIDSLQERLQQAEHQSSQLQMHTPSSSEKTLTQVSSSKSLRRFEKLELRQEEASLQQIPHASQEAQEIELRISKLREIEQQERKTAQSLFRIVGRFKAETQDSPFKTSSPSTIKPPANSYATQTVPLECVDAKVATDLSEEDVHAQAKLVKFIGQLEQTNSQLKKDIERGRQEVNSLQEQLAVSQHNMATTRDSLIRRNIELEEERGRLASSLVDRELEIEQLRLVLLDPNSEQGSTQPHSLEEVPLSKQVEFLQYQNFTLKGRIEELSEICRNLERQLGEEKLSLEKKISNLYNIVEKMEIVAIENEQERVRLETRLLELGEMQQEEVRRMHQEQHDRILNCLEQVEQKEARSAQRQQKWEEQFVGSTPCEDLHEAMSLPNLPLAVEHQQLLVLKNRLKEQEEEIEEMCGCINELQKDLLEKERELNDLRSRGKHERSGELEQIRVRCQQLQNRLNKQEELKVEELQQMFVREQHNLSRIAELEAANNHMHQDLMASECYRADLQRTCEQFSLSLEALKDTNEKLYAEATLLSQQKSEIEDKFVKLLAKRLEKKSSNAEPIEELLVEEFSEREPEYHRLARELRTFLRQLGRLCDQLLNDLETREVVADMNRVNDQLQAKLIELNFSPQFKKSMWDSLEIRADQKNDVEEELKMRDHVNFIEEFLEKSEERNSFCQLVEQHVEQSVGLESQLGTMLNRFLQQLFHHPNHDFLMDRVDELLREVSEYEQHIDNKFRVLEKSIGEYLQQAHAVFQIDEEEKSSHEDSCRSERQARPSRAVLSGFCTEKRQRKASDNEAEGEQQQIRITMPVTELTTTNDKPQPTAFQPEPTEDIAEVAHNLKLELLKQANTRIRQQRKKAMDEERRQQAERSSARRQSSVK